MAKVNVGGKTVSARLSPKKITRQKTDSDHTLVTRKGVQSVEHAMSILEVFTKAERELTVTELSDTVGMPASKTHHYLVSLVRTGVLRQTDSGTYDLGPFALQLGLSSLRRREPIELAVVAAKKLRDANGETTFISIWGSFGPTIIRYFEGFQPVTVEVRAGLTLPLATSATGKVFIAWASETILAPAALRENLSKKRFNNIRKATRQQGLGVVDGDLLPRIASLSAPVFDQDGRLELSITQLGWSGEFDNSPEGNTAKELTNCSRNLSFELGYST